MRSSLGSLGGSARYLSPALLVHQERITAAIPRGRVTGDLARHRIALAVLKMLHASNEGRIGRGIDAVFVAAASTLPKLTPEASARGVAAQERIFDRLAAEPQETRVAVLLAVAHELMDDAPLSRDLDAPCVWRDVLRALGAAQTHAGVEITEAHEATAAQILAGVGL